MLKLRVFVSDIATILATYDRVEIGRAANSADASAQSGTFASLGNVITLLTTIESYPWVDTTGAVGQWYTSRYVKQAGGPTPGPWSSPFQGATMGYISAAEFRDYDLTDLTDLDGSAFTDDQLDRHIATARRLLDAELNGLSFDLRQDIERHRWRGDTRRIYPYQRPLVSADALTLYIGVTQKAVIQASQLFVNWSASYIEVTDLATATYALFPAIASLGLVEPVAELTYTHGYSVIPQDVKDANALTAAEVLAERALNKQGFGGLNQAKIGGYSISRRVTGQSGEIPGLVVPSAAKKLVSHYNVISLR